MSWMLSSLTCARALGTGWMRMAMGKGRRASVEAANRADLEPAEMWQARRRTSRLNLKETGRPPE